MSEKSGGEIILYQRGDEPAIDVRLGGELARNSVVANFATTKFRAMNGEPTYMKDWLTHLEQLAVAIGGKALQGVGKVSHQQALDHAAAEYAKFRSQLPEQPSEVEAAYQGTVKAVQKKIVGKKKP